MAKVRIMLPEEFLKRTEGLADQTDAIIEKAVEAGGQVVLDKVRGNLRAVIGKGIQYKSRSTGELLSSLGLSPVKVDQKGVHNAKVGFNEPRRRQTEASGAPARSAAWGGNGKRSYYKSTNAMVANTIEYGRQGQPAKPFLKPARSASRKACIDAMQKTLDEEVEKL